LPKATLSAPAAMAKESQPRKLIPSSYHFWACVAFYVISYALLILGFGAKARIIEVPALYYIACNYGRWNALAASTLSVPLNLMLFYVVGGRQILATLDLRYWIISVGLILLFYEIGYSRELRRHLKEELRRSRLLATELATEHDRVQRSSEAKDSLLLSISHDLRTPISAMIHSAQLIGTNPRHGSRHAALIQHSGYQLLRVVNDLLRGYRREHDTPILHSEAFDLHRLVNEVIELQAPVFKDKGLYLKLVCDTTLPRWVVGHVLQLRRILVNLLGNSLKYTENGGAKLETQLSVENGTEQLRLIVRDTGCGIPASQIAALMNTLRDKPIPRVSGDKFSYGLGLGNCLRMSDAIGATLQLLPNHPQGLKAILQLPLVRGKPPASLKDRDDGYTLPDLPCPTLIVDDDPIGAETLSAMLAQLGCPSQVSATSREALMTASEQRFDLGFIDLQLPDTNGVTVISDLRCALPAATLVLFSANILLNDFEQWLNPDIDLILSKPIELTELAALCQRAKSERRITKITAKRTSQAIEKRHRQLMLDYLRQALAAYSRQDLSTCAYELHRLASASGTLRLQPIVESARHSERAARQASRIELFSALRELTDIATTVIAPPDR